MLGISLPDSGPSKIVDKLLMRAIACAQGLASVALLAMTPFMLVYGGAAAEPVGFELWIGFWLWGLVSAIYSFKRRLWARIAAAAWNAVALWRVVTVDFIEHHPTRAGYAWLALTAGVTAYLFVTTALLLSRGAVRRRTS
jgi:hypothetical protein